MTPPRENTFLSRSSQQLPRLRLGPFQRATEIQAHAGQVCHPRGPRTPSRTTDANLDCVSVENAFIFFG